MNDKRDEIKDLRHKLREKEEAFSRQNAEIAILKRQLREQEREMNRVRRSNAQPISIPQPSDKHDIAINLKDGNQDDYGKIDQVSLLCVSFKFNIIALDSTRSNPRIKDCEKNSEKRKWHSELVFDQSFGQMQQSRSLLLIYYFVCKYTQIAVYNCPQCFKNYKMLINTKYVYYLFFIILPMHILRIILRTKLRIMFNRG